MAKIKNCPRQKELYSNFLPIPLESAPNEGRFGCIGKGTDHHAREEYWDGEQSLCRDSFQARSLFSLEQREKRNQSLAKYDNDSLNILCVTAFHLFMTLFSYKRGKFVWSADEYLLWSKRWRLK